MLLFCLFFYVQGTCVMVIRAVTHSHPVSFPIRCFYEDRNDTITAASY